MLPPEKVSQKPLSLADYFDIYNVSNTYSPPVLKEVESLNSVNNNTEWGPNRDPLYIVVPITVIYALIFVTGVIGNVSTCIVISRNKSMHTATNYYLFSLAVSDLLLLVSGLPPEMYYIWSKYPYIFGEAFCVVQGFAAETSANATVLTITAFTVERYVAICHPFLSHTMSKLSRAIKFVMAIWVLAMCLAIPQAMAFGIVYQHMADGRIIENNHYVCAVKREIVPHAFELSTLVFFVAPMSLISVLYVLIALQLRRSRIVRRGSLAHSVELKHRVSKTHSGQAVQTVVVAGDGTAVLTGPVDQAEEQPQAGIPNCREDGRKNYPRNMHSKATKHVVNMLIAVVVAFFICWAPFHAQRLLAIHGHSVISTDIIVLYNCLTYLSGILYYLSTCINPFLYNIMSHKFRNAFRETLSRYMSVGGRSRAPARRYSTLSLPRSVSPTRSQSLSQSGGPSRSASFRRGRETDMARRPLVVSFRKPRTHLPTTCIHAARCTCRINYTLRQDHPAIEETSLDTIDPPVFNTPPKVRLFRKWGRKKQVVNANISCKVICSECHRYLSNDSEIHSKISSNLDNSNSSMNDSITKIKESEDSMKINLRIIDNIPMSESDLIPHHRCPNQHSESARSPKGVILQNGFINDQQCVVPHSKTMPDIVKYALCVRNSESKQLPQMEIDESAIKVNNLDEADSKFGVDDEDLSNDIKAKGRKWGSVENITYEIT